MVRYFFLSILAISSWVLNTSGTERAAAPLIIPFGAGNCIVYDLKQGIYSVSFASNTSNIIDAYAVAKTKSNVLDSRAFSFVKKEVTSVNDVFGKGKKYTITRKNNNGVLLKQLFWVYDQQGYFFTQLITSGPATAANYSSPLTADKLQWSSKGDNRILFVPFDNDMWVRYDAHPFATTAFTSSEATAIYNSDDYSGIVIGSIEHNVWKTGIKMNAVDAATTSIAAFGGFTDTLITHDKKPHGFVTDGKNNTVSPKIMVGYFKDWRKGMEHYGMQSRLAAPRVLFNWDKAVPLGWNSWGVIQDTLTLKKANAVVDFFANDCKDFRTKDNTLYIDLDSYWDNLTPSGLSGDLSQLKSFVAHCNQRGLQSGIYWAPFVDWGKGNRKMEGSDIYYPDAWLKVDGQTMDVDGGRALDPTHPAVKKRIDFFIDHFKALGFKMIKIDFLGHATLEADSYADKNTTTGMQAYKQGMEYLANRLGNSMLVYAAISPTMATAPYVHIRRIACDAFKRIDETAYTLNSTTYGWWLNSLYNFSDADHIVFGDASAGENRARFLSSVVTGPIIAGDNFSVKGPWDKAAQDLFQNKKILELVSYDGKAFLPLEVNTNKDAGRFFVKVIGKKLYLAVFNYGNVSIEMNDILARLKNSSYAVHEKVLDMLSAEQKEVSLKQITIPAKDADIFECALQ